jgi:transposase
MTQLHDEPDYAAKQAALKHSGALNPRPQDVRDELFHVHEFFDSGDLVQVKYEMLRRVRVDGMPIAQAAQQFGFSRPAFYKALAAYRSDGLPGLIRKRPGPRGAHKLSARVMQYIDALLAENENLSSGEIAAKVRRRMRLEVHPRSIERALQRQKKKGQ